MIVEFKKAVELLQSGDVVGIPTETVYGLAARIDNEAAVKKIFQVKERPFFDPLIVHVCSIDQAKLLVTNWTETLSLLAKNFWPGPLTLVVPKSKLVSDVITSGLENVAIRMPQHPTALQLIREVGVPLAAPSANKFGKTSPSTAAHVVNEFGDSVFVVDGGPCSVGIESTVVKVVDHVDKKVQLTLLRSGNILLSELVQLLEKNGYAVELIKPGKNIEAPGQVEHHYMPNIPVIFFKSVTGNVKDKLAQLSGASFKLPAELLLSENPVLAARELYTQLRSLGESSNYDSIYFVKQPFHQGEAWEGILDRLWRASSMKID